MNRAVIAFLLVLLCTTCTPSEQSIQTAPTETLQAAPINSPTAQTETLQAAPINSPIPPTETPDPLYGSPEGTTRVDNGVYYMDTLENGKPVTYEWLDLQSGPNPEDKIEGWYANHGEFPLLESDDFFLYGDDQILVTVFFPEGLEGPYLSHPGGASGSNVNLATTLTPFLYKRVVGTSAPHYHGLDEAKIVFKPLTDDFAAISLNVTTSEGMFTWNPAKGVMVIVEDYDEAKEMQSEYIKLVYRGDNTMLFRVRAAGGMLVVQTASKKPWNTLSQYSQAEVILFPILRAIIDENVTFWEIANTDRNIPRIQKLIEHALETPNPHLVIED